MLAVALRMVFNAHWTLALTMISLAALVLLGCEVFPKTLAVRQPERWALRVAWLLSIFQKISRPLYRAAQWLNAALLKKAASQATAPSAMTDAEYTSCSTWLSARARSRNRKRNHPANHQPRPAHGARRDAPRATMSCISDDATVDEMMSAAKKFKHRRLPITMKRRTQSSAFERARIAARSKIDCRR